MELTLLAAALTGAMSVWIANRLLRTRVSVDRPTDVLVGAAAVGLLIGRLAAMIGAGVNPVMRPADILIVRGGVSTGFAALGALGVLAWTNRDRLPMALDQLAPAALAGLAGWHGGCVWRGACLGTASELPWAITSAGTSITRHPVELYAAVGFVVAALVTARFMDRPWTGVGVGLILAGAVRLATEPLRVSITGGPVGWYVAAIVVGIGTAVVGQRLTRTRPPGPSSMEISPP
ncbi:MAG: prolipoprotein diacylglyceryl transferase family protein [Acidimicrobiia bacterium]